MATIQFRRGSNRVTIYYYDPKRQKTLQIPRKDTRHLDGLPIDQVQAWVTEFEKSHGLEKDRIKRVRLDREDDLQQWWEAYQSDRADNKEVGEKTLTSENRLWEGYILPFFIKKHQLKKPSEWYPFIPDFHMYLKKTPIGKDHQKSVLWTLERFSKYLVYQRILVYPFAVNTPRANKRKDTPLPRKLEPKEVLDFARKQDNPTIALFALLGYFASLRPSETGALERDDFLTGDGAKRHSPTYKEFADLGLGSKLAVKITKALGMKSVIQQTKTHYSYGVVTIWNHDAAVLIAAMLKELPKGRVFDVSRCHMDKIWVHTGKTELGVTLHDLRRASALYLGRTLKIDLSLLQKHCRHSQLSTTELYIREPLKDVTERLTQDFDDVG